MFFHTANRTFQTAADTPGPFPDRVSWYFPFSVPQTRGVVGGPGIQPLLSPCPSVVFGAWVPQPGAPEFITPEIYQYLLPPEEQLNCLNLREKIFSLNIDLQIFVVVAGRYFLLGWKEENEDVKGENNNEPRFYNTCVEIAGLS